MSKDFKAEVEKILSKYPKSPSILPTVPYWVIFTQGSVYVPGDERSREAPGHGYPARTEQHIDQAVYTDKAEFEGEIKKLVDRGDKTFRVALVTPLAVTVTVGVQVG